MRKIGDEIRVHNLFPVMKPMGSSSSVEATIFSLPFSVDMHREYAAVVSVEHVSSVGPRQTVEAKLLLGTTTYASPTAYTSIANSSWIVCASGATQTKVDYARISISGTATKAYTQKIAIDGTTFTLDSTADSSVLIHSTDCSNAAAKLATAIKTCCTYLNATYYAAGVTTGPAHVEIAPRDGNRTFNVTSTSIYPGASADGMGLTVSRSAMYEWKQEDLHALSTLPYTRAVVRVQTTGTVARVHGYLMAGDARYKPDHFIERGQFATVSSAYAT